MEFILDNFIWIGVIAVILLLALIGYLSETTGATAKIEKKNKEAREKKGEVQKIKEKEREERETSEIKEIKGKIPENAGIATLLYKTAEQSKGKKLKETPVPIEETNKETESKPIEIKETKKEITKKFESHPVEIKAPQKEITNEAEKAVITETGENLSVPLEGAKNKPENELPSLDDIIDNAEIKNEVTDEKTKEEDVWKF